MVCFISCFYCTVCFMLGLTLLYIQYAIFDLWFCTFYVKSIRYRLFMLVNYCLLQFLLHLYDAAPDLVSTVRCIKSRVYCWLCTVAILGVGFIVQYAIFSPYLENAIFDHHLVKYNACNLLYCMQHLSFAFDHCFCF